jgi:hypothetical protein
MHGDAVSLASARVKGSVTTPWLAHRDSITAASPVPVFATKKAQCAGLRNSGTLTILMAVPEPGNKDKTPATSIVHS